MSGVVPSTGQSRIPCEHRSSAINCLACNTQHRLKGIVHASAYARGIRFGRKPGAHVETVEDLLRMEMEEFEALILLRMDIWNSTCAPRQRMTLLNYGELWEIDHVRFLGGVAKDDIAGKLARCVGWLQKPLPHHEHGEKSHGERTHKSQAMIAAEQHDLANRVTEARAHVKVSQKVYGSNSQNAMDTLERLGNILFDAELHAEARDVEVALRRMRVLMLGWDNPQALDSCARLATVQVALGQHDDAMEVLDPAFDAHCQKYGREDPRTLRVVELMVHSLGELGDRHRVTKLLLCLTDDEMELRVRAKQAQALEVRCRRGPVSVSVLASCPQFDLRFPATEYAHEAN
jgi:hypothetical protein